MKVRKLILGLSLILVVLFTGCIGGCFKEITLHAEYDISTISQPIHNVTRSDLSAIPWFISELDKFPSDETNYSVWIITEENYTALRSVFIDLGIITNSSLSVGTGSALQSSYNYLMDIYLRFEALIIQVTVVNWCGS